MIKTPKTVNAFGLDPWILADDGFVYESHSHWHKETIYSLGNGCFGSRGNLDEFLDDDDWSGIYGCFLNGSYEYSDILYSWRRYGLATQNQTILRIPDWHLITLKVEGQLFSMLQGRVDYSSRHLNMQEGSLKREVVWESPAGHRLRIVTEKLISMPDPESACIRYEVENLGDPVEIELESGFDGKVKNIFTKKYPLSPVCSEVERSIHKMVLKTKRSRQTICMAGAFSAVGFSRTDFTDKSQVGSTFSKVLENGQSAMLEKHVGIELVRTQEDEVMARLEDSVKKGLSIGFSARKDDQVQWWSKFWETADIEIIGNPAIQQGIRYVMFQLAQSAGRDKFTNIAAKGMTGYLHEGKVFWDTEVYMVPFFANLDPEWARTLLEFRYNTLDIARNYAEYLGFKGALFPWETINGEECAFIFEASTAQYHVNAAIGYAVKRYFEATGDQEYLRSQGIELLVETSRFFLSLGAYIPDREGKFCICEVCGPDEYSPMVDNNCYTNTMVREHLLYTVKTLRDFKNSDEMAWQAFIERLELSREEPVEWTRAAESMYIPYHEEKGIHLQDDQFYNRPPVKDLEKWRFEHRYAEKKIHPLNLFRAQVIKQADIILLMALRSLDYDTEQKRRNYEYYEPKTLHSSSLSACMYSITACEIGHTEHALPYLFNTVRLDLDNYGGAEMGLHTASLGGAWRGIIQGLGGVAFSDGHLDISPRLPRGWTLLAFKFRYQGSLAKLQICPDGASLEIISGAGLKGTNHGKDFSVQPEKIILLNVQAIDFKDESSGASSEPAITQQR